MSDIDKAVEFARDRDIDKFWGDDDAPPERSELTLERFLDAPEAFVLTESNECTRLHSELYEAIRRTFTNYVQEGKFKHTDCALVGLAVMAIMAENGITADADTIYTEDV